MKKMAKKLLAMLLVAVIAVSGMVVTAAAAGSLFDGAVELKELEKTSISDYKQAKAYYYKIDIPREGTFKLNVSGNYCTQFEIKNGDDETIATSAKSAKEFYVENLQKGTYYLKAFDEYNTGFAYVREMYYTFIPNEKPVISFGMTIKKGDTVQLDAITENYDGKVTWKSTKKSIATVNSKGLVTAKKAGTTYIRAQMDNGDYIEIKVVVKSK